MPFLMLHWISVASFPLAPVVADGGVVTLQQVPAWIGALVTVGTMLAGVTATVTMVRVDIGTLRADVAAVRLVAERTEARLTGHIENDHAPHAVEVFTRREAEESRRTADEARRLAEEVRRMAEESRRTVETAHAALRAEVNALRRE